MPPRSRSAMFWASIVSCVALPPWIAFMESAWPSTTGIPSRAQRSASQYQVKSPFDADDEIGPVGCDGLQKRCWASGQVPVEKHLSLLVEDTEGPWCGHADRCRSQIDA